MALSESYVGPNVRLAMLKADYPAACHVEEWIEDISISDVPPAFRPTGKGATGFCRCVIDFGPGADRPPVTADRFPDVKGVAQAKSDTTYDPVGWEALSTKTLGRALKEAGYPPDANDIKLLLLWRRRMAEIHGDAEGAVIDAAARPDADEPQHEPDEGTAAVAPAPGAPRPPQPSAAQPATGRGEPSLDDLGRRVAALGADNRAKLEKFMSDRGWVIGILAGPGGPGNTARAYLESLEKQEGRTWPPEPAADAPGGDPWDPAPAAALTAIAAELDTWDPTSREQFAMLLEANKVPRDITSWDQAHLDKALGLMEQFSVPAT